MSKGTYRRPGEPPPAGVPEDHTAIIIEDRPELTIEQLGWTPEDAAAIRASLSSFAADWDHPSMIIYDGL